MQGVVDGHAVVAGRERFLADWSHAPRRHAARGTRRGRSSRAHADLRRLGRPGARGARRVRHDQGRRRPKRSPVCADSVCARCCSPATTNAPPETVASPGRHRRGHRRGPPRRQGRRHPTPPGRGTSRRDGRRRRQRRRRARPGRPRSRDGNRHRRRDRSQRHHARARRPARRRRRDPPVRANARRRSRATCSGRSPTTSPPCHSPPPDCSTRCSPAWRWRSRASSSCRTASGSVASDHNPSPAGDPRARETGADTGLSRAVRPTSRAALRPPRR